MQFTLCGLESCPVQLVDSHNNYYLSGLGSFVVDLAGCVCSYVACQRLYNNSLMPFIDYHYTVDTGL